MRTTATSNVSELKTVVDYFYQWEKTQPDKVFFAPAFWKKIQRLYVG